jgi:hypothetical protein
MAPENHEATPPAQGSEEARVSVDELERRLEERSQRRMAIAVKEVPALSAIGWLLARRVLKYLLIATVAALAYGVVVVFLVPLLSAPPAKTVEEAKEIFSQRYDHVLNVLSVLLKETALPIIMAILGYIFGSYQSRRVERAEEGASSTGGE